MNSLSPYLSLAHLLGLALGVGAASVKLLLLIKCHADHGYLPVYLKVVRPITHLIVLGLILLTLSGIGWLLLVGGYPYTPRLIVKLVIVAALWLLGPIIDNFAEPKFLRLAPAPGQSASDDFIRVQMQYLTLEAVATGAFYFITVAWVLSR